MTLSPCARFGGASLSSRAAFAAVLSLLLASVLCLPAASAPGRAWADEAGAPAWDDAPGASSPEERLSYLRELAEGGNVTIHVMAFMSSDAILVESDGRFGLVDAGEDDDYPDGSDPRYPLRDGIIIGEGHEDELIAYMKSLGVTSGNLEFVLGTHPHSDHIGALDEVIYEFQPSRVYLMEYQDSYVTRPDDLWDNLYVYDHVLQATADTGAVLVRSFDEAAPVIPASREDAPEPDSPGDAEGAPGTGEDAPVAFGEPADDSGDSLIGNPVFMLGSALIEVMNYSEDYKHTPKPDANYFSLGVKVSAGGKSGFLAGDINNYGDGDETMLAPLVGKVDFLKLGHHGGAGSNTSDYLRTLSPSVVMQTSDFPGASQALVDDSLKLGYRYYDSAVVTEKGLPALAVTFEDGRLTTNIAVEGYRVRSRSSSPHYYLFRNFAPVRYSGIVEDQDRRFFFKNSFVALEDAWYTDGSGTYRLDSDGLPLEGFQTVDGKRYCFDEETGALLKGPQWIEDGTSRFRVTADGSFASGWHLVEGLWYWLDPQTYAMATGWLEVDGKRYVLEDDGAMAADRWVLHDGQRYWASASGALSAGWRLVGDRWYWLDPQTYAMATGWYKVNGEWNWSDSEGVWHPNEWKRDAAGWWYAWADGTYPTSSWQLIDGEWYRLDGSGYICTGWCLAGGRWYYLAGDGAMRIGWQRVDGEWYYLGDSVDDGAMRTGWQKVSGQWYFLEDSGAMATGWKRIGGAWYYLTGSGSMAVGWQKVGGEWYYLGDSPDDGAMRTGWQKVGGTWYFLHESGAMAHSSWVGSYYVDGSGAMVTDAWVDGYYVDATGRWDPSK